MPESKSVNELIEDNLIRILFNLMLTSMNHKLGSENPDTNVHLLMIDIGDISRMIGYTFKIIDFLGKVVYESLISQQVIDLDLNQIGGRGTYFLEVIDNRSQIIEINKIVLH
jgi:hypothetical protein